MSSAFAYATYARDTTDTIDIIAIIGLRQALLNKSKWLPQ